MEGEDTGLIRQDEERPFFIFGFNRKKWKNLCDYIQKGWGFKRNSKVIYLLLVALLMSIRKKEFMILNFILNRYPLN